MPPRWTLWLAVGGVFAGAVLLLSYRASGVTFPPEPARCAGPSLGSIEKQRQETGRYVRDEVERAGSNEVEIWMSFAKVLSAEEAAVIVDGSPVSGVLLAYQVQQNGPSVTVVYAPNNAEPTDVATLASAAFERGSVPQEPELVPIDPAVARGVPPVVGVRLRESGDILARFIAANDCDVYSVDIGETTGHPVLSPMVAPD